MMLDRMQYKAWSKFTYKTWISGNENSTLRRSQNLSMKLIIINFCYFVYFFATCAEHNFFPKQ